MKSILQLVGGVAVAGAVAAGSTAFTAAGLTNGAGTVVGGGKLSAFNVVGAQLGSVKFGYVSGNADQINKILMTITDGTNPLTTGTMSVTVTTTGGTASLTPTCSYVSGSSAWVCADSTNYWTGLGTIAVNYETA
ncbi:hypothetical protein [Actinoplanes sp. NPDC020271]|uniref:hypothetical protein n=1 Tax=Actinoplanes sp. NPDC020271 TaxID=3363896 RepID=UPI003791F2CF